MEKTNSEFKSVQKKLMAAVSMVLVAAIMVVSTSYAWFTLSTAPEVTGITTSVGSNGNLEMALITSSLDDIGNAVGESYPEANNTWGNLVDLKYDTYALDKISLAPARLNFTGDAENGATVASTYIYTPVYGTDGRISQFQTIAQSGSYSNSQFVADSDSFGVRAIGTASGLSAGALALRNARSEVNTAKSTVNRLARTSLEVDAINLANLIVANVLSAKDTVTDTEWKQVTDAVDNLAKIATSLKETMDKVVNAVAVSQDVDMTGKTITYSTSGATVENVTINIPDALQTGLGVAYTTWTEINTKVTTAQGFITNASAGAEGTHSYDTVESIMTSILSVSDITLGKDDSGKDITLSGKSKEELMSTVVNAYLENEGKLPLYIVNGIYKEIGDFIGTYSASAKMTVSLVGTSYASMGDKITVTAQMRVENAAPTSINAYILDYFVTQLSSLSASDAGNSNSETVLSDIYAYAIDLAFRTNAADSKLMLQTAATSRVGDDTTEAVQGGGSYMQFTIGDDENYTVDQMKDLMEAIRVVLVSFSEDGNAMNIYGVAALDMNVAEESTVNGKNVVKAYLYLYEYEQESSGKLTLGDKIVTENTDGTKTAITALTQNQALGVTALVYLDGDEVDNSDVAVSGNSMTGTLNLQFSSDADLDPMDYTFTDTNNDDDDDDETPATPTLDSNMAVPTATLSEKSLTIGTAGEGVTKYVIAVDGTPVTTVNAADAGTPVDLTSNLTGESHTITVVAYNDTANTMSSPQTISYSTNP